MAQPVHFYPVQRICRLFRKSPPLAWMLYDALASLLIFWSVSSGAGLTQTHIPALGIGLTCFLLLAGCVFGLYEKHILIGRINLTLVVLETAVGGLLLSLVFMRFHGAPAWNWVLLLKWICLTTAALYVPRVLGSYALRLHKIKVLAVASAARARKISRHLRRGSDCHVLVGYCNDDPPCPGDAGPLGPLARIPALCGDHDVDIVVADRELLTNPVVTNGCLMAARLGCEVHSEVSFLEGFLERVDPDSFDRGAILLASFADRQPFALFVKRILDFVAACLGLILTSWLVLLVYLVLRASSKGPVFYLQERCGLFGEPFRIIKFRSMHADAEKNGPVWAARNDPRATRLGRFLRQTHLDELPQLWNILKGEMSFVGPRPERPEMARILEESVPPYSFRHWVRPGLTGLAQIRFRYSNTIEDARTKLQYDLYYLKNWSLVLDALILLRTIATLMRGSW